MKKEQYFLDYNDENLMKNSLAIEDHLRNLDNNYGKGHASCVTKHALILIEQLDEAQSHCTIAAPEKCDTYRELKKEIREFKDEIENGLDPDKGIRKIREFRSKIESSNPLWDTANCKACTRNSETESYEGRKVYKDANTESIIMTHKQIATAVGGVVVGGLAEQLVLEKLPIPNFGGIRGKDIVGVLGGLAIAYVSAKASTGKNKDLATVGLIAGATIAGKNIMQLGNSLLGSPYTAGLSVMSPSGLPRYPGVVTSYNTPSTITVD